MQTFTVLAALAAAVSAVPFSPPTYEPTSVPSYGDGVTTSLVSLRRPTHYPTTYKYNPTGFVPSGRVGPTGTGRVGPTGTGRSGPISTGTGVPKNQNSGSAGTSSYKMFTGDGSTGAGWPAESDWVGQFDDLWSAQSSILSASCENNFKQPNNNAQENDDLKAAIQSVAKDNNVDPRFVLAIAMQESKGCVRVWNTTAPGSVHINNPGLFQDHNGAHSCNTGTSSTAGTVSNPCPKDQITGMVSDGVAGTNGITGGGDGLKQTYGQAQTTYKATDAQAYYIAARIYNSGSYDGSDLGAKGATRCYASDVANRLLGWNGGSTGCTLDSSS